MIVSFSFRRKGVRKYRAFYATALNLQSFCQFLFVIRFVPLFLDLHRSANVLPQLVCVGIKKTGHFLIKIIFESTKLYTDRRGHCAEDTRQADGGCHPFGNEYPTR